MHFSVAIPGYVATDIFREDRIVGAKMDEVLAKNPFASISAEQAAQAILRGVEKNRRHIVFPGYA